MTDVWPPGAQTHLTPSATEASENWGPKRRGSLRCLPPLEVRPSSVAPDPAESRGAPPPPQDPCRPPWESSSQEANRLGGSSGGSALSSALSSSCRRKPTPAMGTSIFLHEVPLHCLACVLSVSLGSCLCMVQRPLGLKARESLCWKPLGSWPPPS